jgi:hypothetical protein
MPEHVWDSLPTSGDRHEPVQEGIKIWPGSCGLATCHAITFFARRQQYAHGMPLAQNMEYLAVWRAEQDGAPAVERERSHPVDAFSTGHSMRRMQRAEGRAVGDVAAVSREVYRQAVAQTIECFRHA